MLLKANEDSRRVFFYFRKRGIACRLIENSIKGMLLYENNQHYSCGNEFYHQWSVSFHIEAYNCRSQIFVVPYCIFLRLVKGMIFSLYILINPGCFTTFMGNIADSIDSMFFQIFVSPKLTKYIFLDRHQNKNKLHEFCFSAIIHVICKTLTKTSPLRPCVWFFTDADGALPVLNIYYRFLFTFWAEQRKPFYLYIWHDLNPTGLIDAGWIMNLPSIF